MSMTPEEIAAAAHALDAAEKSRQQVGLLSVAHKGMDMDDAYAVQAAWVDMKRAAGDAVVGWKIGLTSKAMQYALNIDTPDSGVLFASMQFDNGATIPAGHFIQPRIEAEIAFVMKRPLRGRDITLADVLDATDYVVPALEILDTRILRKDPISGQTRLVFDTIADNAANAGIIVGSQTFALDQLDLRWAGAIVSRNGEVEETGLGAGVLDNPAQGIVWLVRRLAEYGDGIEAGQVVLSGSFIRPVEAPPGSAISADFGPLGKVSCYFA